MTRDRVLSRGNEVIAASDPLGVKALLGSFILSPPAKHTLVSGLYVVFGLYLVWAGLTMRQFYTGGIASHGERRPVPKWFGRAFLVGAGLLMLFGGISRFLR